MLFVTRILGAAVPLVLALVPGWGHVWLHRTYRGLLVFMLFFSAVNVVLVARLGLWVEAPDLLVRLCQATAAAAWVFSIVDVARTVLWSRSRTVRERRSRILRRIIGHYLRGEHGQAEEQTERLLRIDPLDATALVYLASIQRADGRPGPALRSFRRARGADVRGAWRATLDLEIESTKDLNRDSA